jgi:osmotically-inducible protein OsmY
MAGIMQSTGWSLKFDLGDEQMPRHNPRDERDWPQSQQSRSGQYRWQGGRRDDEYESESQSREGRNWRDEEYQRRGQERAGQSFRSDYERPSGPQANYGTEGRGGSWQNQRWQEAGPGDRRTEEYGSRYSSGRQENWNDRYAGLGGRGWREGLTDAMHQGQYSGRGPRNYKRSDSRIEEDINDRLTMHPMLDATDIEVSVQNGEVTLRGQADNRDAKRLAEDIAESVFGAREVNNQIRVRRPGEAQGSTQETGTQGQQRKAG